MKTVLLAIEYPPAIGGVENYYGNLHKYWPDEIITVDNSQNQLLKKSGPLKWRAALLTVFRLCRQARPDWIIAGEILPLGTVSWLLSYFFPFRYAVVLHGYDFSLAIKGSRKRFLTKAIIKRAGLVVCANSYTAVLVQNFLPQQKKIAVINPGVEIKAKPSSEEIIAWREKYNLQNYPFILTVARLVERKGIDRVIAAMPTIINRYPDFRYVIIGGGSDEERIRKLIKRSGVADNIMLLNNLDDQARDLALAACDIFVLTARNMGGDYEGFGIVYLEAGAFTKAVVAGLSGGVGDAVEDGYNGLRVDEENSSLIAETLLKLIDDENLRRRLGQNGLEKARRSEWSQRVKAFYQALKNHLD